jgi:long-chain acyl-CoA synthetase
VAGFLIARGLQPGSAVGIQLPNVPEYVAAWFGVLRAGMVAVPLNPALTPREVEHQLQDAGAKLLVTSEESIPTAPDLPVVRLSLPGLGELADAEPFDEVAPTSSEDTAVLVYTSGTTGTPKGAELTHLQLVMNAQVSGELFGVGAGDVSLAVVPLFHVYGLSVTNVAVRHGVTLRLMRRFDAAQVVEAIERDRVTLLFGVPTMLVALLQEDVRSRDLSSLRLGCSGGASLPGEVMQAFEAAFGLTVLEGYGLSETASTVTFNRSATDRKLLSIGKPVWGVEVRVVDENDRPLPPGRDHIGELVVRGHNVMKGYRGNPEATAEALRGGWFHTGDLGYADEDGFLFLVDRKKDLVIRGGYNVYPREVEEVLYGHPGVMAAAVVGRPDPRLGEEVVAVLVAQPGVDLHSDDISAFCSERLAPYKRPREIRIVSELPVGPTGKVDKVRLRAELPVLA